MILDKHPLIFIKVSAALFGISPPLAKLLLNDIPPVTLAGLLYLGAFIGLSFYSIGRRKKGADRYKRAAPLERKDFLWLVGALLSGGVIRLLFSPYLLYQGYQIFHGGNKLLPTFFLTGFLWPHGILASLTDKGQEE